ncbi:MAG: helicase C-terminal domain-containing protein [Opitutaceae bacterium]
MTFDLDLRRAAFGVGEFAGFVLGPRDAGDGQGGLWRAQLGTHWHQQLRSQTAAESSAAEFEVAIAGQIFHRGWTLTFNGRIDQLLRTPGIVTLREIKTVTQPLPANENDLRADYPEYFVQIATYAALWRLGLVAEIGGERLPLPGSVGATVVAPLLRAELLFVEAGSGLAQTVAVTQADEALFQAQLDRITEFLDLRLRARERLRHLTFRPPFHELRPGQETTQAELTAAFERCPLVLLEAPTGFGKTGLLLEFALGQLRAGHLERVLYLTSKSTGQLQVVRTLAGMTAPNGETRATNGASMTATTQIAVWHVRNKGEHCVNDTFHCVRENCAYLDKVAARWPQSGLARFYRFENQARDLETLRAAGRAALICPYEITRAALAFNDVWVGDYNYVFAPNNRSLFFQQPGFDPARTLLILDEAHNLPSRVADAYSHRVLADDARALLAELDHLNAPAPLVHAWESWTLLLAALPVVDVLDPALEADAAETLRRIADQLASLPIDYAALGPQFAALLWQTPLLAAWLEDTRLKKLLWSPRAGELHFTCIDAADAIGETLRGFGGAVFASATLSPVDAFAESCGLTAAHPHHHLRAHTPWRDTAYDVAVDARVDTRFQQRARHHATTAATVALLHESARGPVAVFFPSYAYAEIIARELDRSFPGVRVALQPKLRDLAAQTAWVEESLALSDALFLVLGSSFAESIDALGGRVTHAMVVGPALPEVNAVQQARLAEFSALGREAAFRRVYQIPGMAKVNQALGRLVRAPGQRARVILHCQRFLEPSYASLLAPEYQFGVNVLEDADLAAWLLHKT